MTILIGLSYIFGIYGRVKSADSDAIHKLILLGFCLIQNFSGIFCWIFFVNNYVMSVSDG